MKKGKKAFQEVIGWIGTVLILVAFALLGAGILDGQSMPYMTMNAIGALALMYHSWVRKDYQPVALNVVWLLVALLAMVRMW